MILIPRAPHGSEDGALFVKEHDVVGYRGGRHWKGDWAPADRVSYMQEREEIELIVRTTENGNQGHVFFKCPKNVPGVRVFLVPF